MSSWADIELALQNAVEVATGLDDAHVIFAEQEGQRPSLPYVTLRIGDTVGRGEFVTHVHDADADELVFTAYSHPDLLISINAYTAETTGNTARALLEALRLKLALPAARDALRAVGVTPRYASTVRNLTALDGADFRGRAQLDVRCEVVRTAEERVPYIRTVEVTDSGTGQTIDVELP